MSGEATLGEREIELALIAGAALIAWVAVKGIKGAAAQAGSLVVDAATGVAVGVTDTAGQVIGLPKLSDITTDAGVSRWIWDNPQGGWASASKWSSAGALYDAGFMDAGSGSPPPADSKIARIFPAYNYVAPEWGMPL